MLQRCFVTVSLLLACATVEAQVAIQGVYVDADGVLQTVAVRERSEELDQARARAQQRVASDEVSKVSAFRQVSLVEIAKLLAAGEEVSADLENLAGLTRIDYVLVYPEQNDVVLVGPAEGWTVAPDGRSVGVKSGRPTVQLDDLLVALRLFQPNEKPPEMIACSINATQAGLVRLQQYMAKLGRSIDRRRANRALVEGVRTALGLQDITLYGVGADTRLAMTLIEADYRMKLIGIGLEDPGVRGIVSYTSLLKSTSGGTNKMQRWWFVPDYSAIRIDENAVSFGFEGPRAQLLSADDFVKQTGEVVRNNKADRINKQFATRFTRNFQKLAEVNPVFADLQNAFDVIMAAAVIHRFEVNEAVDGGLTALWNDPQYQIPSRSTPRHVWSVVNYKWIGTKLAMPVGGGVKVEASRILAHTTDHEKDGAAKLESLRARTEEKEVHRWWWD